jgi:hypothetical protein
VELAAAGREKMSAPLAGAGPGGDEHAVVRGGHTERRRARLVAVGPGEDEADNNNKIAVDNKIAGDEVRCSRRMARKRRGMRCLRGRRGGPRPSGRSM